MSKKSLYIILNSKDAKSLPSQAKYVFCRSNIFTKYLNKNIHKVITPNPKKTSKESINLFKKETKLSELIVSSTKKFFKNSQVNSFEELLRPYLSLRISGYLYLESILPKANNYLIYKRGEWLSIKSRVTSILEIEKKLSLEVDSIYSGLKVFTVINNSIIYKLLGFLQRKLLKIRLKGIKKLFVLTDKKRYFFHDLTNLLKEKKSNILYLYNGNNIYRIFTLIILIIISFFNKKYFYNGIFLISKDYCLIPKYENFIKRKIKKSNYISNDYADTLSRDLNIYLSNTFSYLKYIKSIFENIKIDIKIISHSKRFTKIYSLTEALEKEGHNNYLISHGSHTIQKGDLYDEQAADQLALGLLYSDNESTILCSQSYFADEYLRSQNKEFIKINPVEFLNSKINLNKNDNSSEKLNILHACTIKQMGCKRYLYHSSGEYVQSLRNICKKLKPINKDIRFIIRIRPVQNEISINYLKYYLRDYMDFVYFSNVKSFINELSNIDCLLALSSTTLEQSINNSIPAMSIGETGYDHFKNYKNYNLPKTHKNYDQLRKIENLLGKKFIFISNHNRKNVSELQDIIY